MRHRLLTNENTMPSIATLMVLALLGFALSAVPRQTETEGQPPVLPSDPVENEVVASTDQEPPEGGDGFSFRFDLDPFAGFESMLDRFRRFQEVMRNMQSHMFNLTSALPTSFDNSTEEIVEIGGQKYRLVRKVIRKGDNESSVLFSATSLTPVDRRKRELTNLDEKERQ